MKAHTKIYMKFFGYKEGDYMPCEIDTCWLHANDIHHIEPRKMGGDPQGKKDIISNLMAVCRNHHNLCENGTITKDRQKEVHLKFMQEFKVTNTKN